ncbi:MAG TPA: type II secretion system F family protein [Methylococcaceae bacterium]|nr:type II secretion system F family protein [Methylococcaceae bacterium]
MASFSWRARDAQGELAQGVLEGEHGEEVAAQLVASGLTPVEIVPARQGARDGAAENPLARWFAPKVSTQEILLFSRQMHTLLKAGVPIVRSLSGLHESTDNPAFQEVLRDLREGLEGGRELSVVMRRHPEVFTPFYANMVRVGESTGRMEEIFLRLFHYLEFERHTREQIRSALRYPTFVILVIVAAVAVINLFVIPAFAKVYAGFNAELPTLTRVLIDVSNFTVNYWLPILGALVGLVVGFRYYTRQGEGKLLWDRLKLRLPIIGGIVEKATLARFARSFSLASRSGVPIVQGLSVIALVVDNDFIAGKVERMRDGLERGESILRTAAGSGVFTPVVLQMIAVGEETGDLDGLMEEIAGMYEREVDYAVKNLSASIEPILIIALGILIALLALGVFLPIWDLGKAALHK